MNILQTKEKTLKLPLRFLANTKNRSWLSKQVQAEIKDQYPQLYSAIRLQRLETYKKYLPRWPMILAGILSIVFVLINESIIYFDVFFPLDLNSQQVASFLTNLVAPLVATLGVVIPLIILLIEFLGRDYSNIIDIYLDKVEILKVAVWALITLGLYGITLFIISITNTMFPARVFLYVSVFFLLMTLAILAEVGLALIRIKHSLSYDFVVQSLRDRIYHEVVQNQFDQARYRHLQKSHQGILKSLDIPLSPLFRNQKDGILLAAPKTGVITDIHLQRLEQFAQSLQKLSGKDPSIRGYTLKQVGDFVKRGDAIVCVAPDQTKNIHYLQKKLNESFKIKGKFTKSSDITRLLPNLKQVTLIAVREESEILFDQLLDVYLNILALGIGPTPPSTDFYSTLFPGWNVTNTVASHLKSIIEVAAQNKNDHFIHELASRLSIVVSTIIQQSDIQVSESTRNIFGLFFFIYFYSKQNDNQTGIRQSYSYLTKSVIDIAWINKFERVYTQLESLHNLERLLGMIYYDTLLNGIAHSMLESQHLDDLASLLNSLQPEEFLPQYHHIWQQIDNEKWEFEWKLRDDRQEEKENLEAQLSTLRLASAIRQDIEECFNQFVFVATSYTLERYNRNEISSTQVKNALDVLHHNNIPFNQLVYLFKKLTESEGRTWQSFHRHPDTKHAFFPDDEGKYYLFYCLRGIELIANSEIPDTLPLIDLDIQSPRIESFCSSIADNPTKWSLLLEGDQDIPSLAHQFVEVNKQIKENWKTNREEEIIKADLDPLKIKAFEDAFWEKRNSTQSLRTFLEDQGRVSYDIEFSSKEVLEFSGRRIKEHFSTLHPDLTDVQEQARFDSAKLTGMEDDFLVSNWLKYAKTVPTRKDWESLEFYLERAFKHLTKEEYNPCLIIIPSMFEYYYLQRMEKFVNAQDVKSPAGLPHLRGFYDEVPILEWPSNIVNDNILVVDTEKAVQLEIEYIKPEIKLLPEHQIKRIIANEKLNADERQFRLAIWVNIREKAKIKILDKNAIVKLPIKLPNKGRYKLGPITSLEQAG